MSENTNDLVKVVDVKDCDGKSEDLDELLDSALQDFDDTPENSTEAKLSPVFSREDNLRPKSGGGGVKDDSSSSESNSRSLLFGDGDVESVLNSILNSSDGTAGSSDSSSVDDVIAGTMEKLTKSSQGIEDDLADMLKNIDMNDDSALFPFVQGALQTFLCKDILYPSMSEIKDRYPVWMDENKSKLSETDYNRYIKQYEHIRQICVEFEKEKDDDTEQVKKERFQKLLELMQKVNECGDPPSELVGDQLYNPMAGMNSLNMSSDENALNQCPIS